MAHAKTPHKGQQRASARKRQRQAERGGKPAGISPEILKLMDLNSKAHRRAMEACPTGYRGW